MNLPNKITLTRILMIPVFVLIFFLDNPFAYGIAGIIFAVAAFTDFIDGKIARSRGLVTNLGKFLDPIADKVLVSTAMILMLAMGEFFIPFASSAQTMYVITVLCICIIMARELIISAFRQIAAANGVIMAAEKLGKYKTACQDVSIFVIFLSAGILEYSFKTARVFAWIGIILFFLATVLTIVSAVSYVVKNKQVLKDKQ